MTTREERRWSDLTIQQIEDYLKRLVISIPFLKGKLEYRCAPGQKRSPDVEVLLRNREGTNHYLLIEVEQYASGRDLQSKVRGWAKRHLQRPNTTTIVVSLILHALHNRLVSEFSTDTRISQMVFSPQFRIFSGSGDGAITDETKSFIASWIKERL